MRHVAFPGFDRVCATVCHRRMGKGKFGRARRPSIEDDIVQVGSGRGMSAQDILRFFNSPGSAPANPRGGPRNTTAAPAPAAAVPPAAADRGTRRKRRRDEGDEGDQGLKKAKNWNEEALLAPVHWDVADLVPFAKDFTHCLRSPPCERSEAARWRRAHGVMLQDPKPPAAPETVPGTTADAAPGAAAAPPYPPIRQYRELDCAAVAVGALTARFAGPTPVQAQVWPVLLRGRDCVAVAPTGTGKTLAFMVPALVHAGAQTAAGPKQVASSSPRRNGCARCTCCTLCTRCTGTTGTPGAAGTTA